MRNDHLSYGYFMEKTQAFMPTTFLSPIVYLPLCTNNKTMTIVKDANGNVLQEGDSVTVMKDLKVKGSSQVLKRGTKADNIRLTDDPDEIEARIKGSTIVLKTCFVKKS